MPAEKPAVTTAATAGSRNSFIAAVPLSSKRKTIVLTTKQEEGTTSQEVTPTQQAPSANSAWANGGGANLIRSTAGATPAQSTVARSTYNPSALRVPNSQALLTTQMSQMNLGSNLNPNAAYYDPSQGPTPSAVTNNWRTAPSQTSNRSIGQKLNTIVCVLSGYTKQDFQQGQIISLPFHTPNTNPNVAPTDHRLTLTCEGPAYTKRRMMVVLWLFEQDMFCLPLYSFEGKGIQGKPAWLRKEYVSMKNASDRDFRNQGFYDPVAVQMRRKPMNPMTAVHLTGGTRVGCQEDISMIGRMTQEGHRQLVRLWRTLNQAAQEEAW